jgi:O-antigen ligase
VDEHRIRRERAALGSPPVGDGEAAFDPLDVVGLSLTVALLGWLVISAGSSGGSVTGPIGVLLGSAVAFSLGRLAPPRWGGRLAAILVIVAAGLAVWAWPDIVGRRPLGRPIGYANATAAFYVQAGVAGSMLMRATRFWPLRILTIAVVSMFAAVPFIIGSTAGALAVLVVVAVGVIGSSRWPPLSWVTVFGTAFLATLVGTIVIGAGYSPRGGDGAANDLAGALLSERRLALWSDAIHLIEEKPLFGVGGGRFEVESPVARSDPDTRRAHHEVLQVAAETGIVGGALVAGLFLWGILRLGVFVSPNTSTLIVAAGVTALALHACVDYVLHFPIVPLSASLLAGIEAGRSKPNSRSGSIDRTRRCKE